MYEQNTTTGVSRMDPSTRAGQLPMSPATAFLRKAEVDERLAEKIGEADGDMPLILAIAAAEGYVCAERELLVAYEQHVREQAAAAAQAASQATDVIGAPSDAGYPIIYLSLQAPSDIGHPIVYLA